MTIQTQLPPSPPWSTRNKRAVVVMLLVLLLLFLYVIRAILIPVILALVVAYVLLPIIRVVHERTPLSRGMSVGIVYLFLVAGLLAIPITTVPQLIDEGNNLINRTPEYLDEVGVFLSQPLQLGGFTIPLDQYPILDQIYANLSGNLIDIAQRVGRQSFSVIGDIAGATLTILGWIVVVLVLSFYMVTDHGQIVGSMVKMLPEAHRGDVSMLGREISRTWNAFLRGQLLLCLTVGAVTFVIALIIGLPNALVLALIAGIAEFVPNLGPVLAAIPALLVALFQSDASWVGAQMTPLAFAAVVLALYIAIQQVENIVLVPRIIGRSLGLQPIVVFIGAIAGATVAGILGILLAAPLLASARLVLVYISRKLSDVPPFPLQEPKIANKGGEKVSFGERLRRLRTGAQALLGSAGQRGAGHELPGRPSDGPTSIEEGDENGSAANR